MCIRDSQCIDLASVFSSGMDSGSKGGRIQWYGN
jgi:hypothetical protein